MLQRADKDGKFCLVRKYHIVCCWYIYLFIVCVVSELSKSDNTVGHVKYDSLIADPVGTVRDLYESFGWNFSAEYEGALHAYIKKNKEERAFNKSRSAKHSYSLDQYGLSETDIAQQAGWYSKKYL